MATRLSESRVDHDGKSLPQGVYALADPRGEIVSYKARWREEDENGVQHQRSKSFSQRELGSLDKARTAALNHREGALAIVRAGDSVLRPDRAAGLTLGELFKDWIANHAAHNTGERYARDSIRTWDTHIEPRLERVKLGTLASDPSIIVRFHEELQQASLAVSARRASLALLRSVLRWGRRLITAPSGHAGGAPRVMRGHEPVAAHHVARSRFRLAAGRHP